MLETLSHLDWLKAEWEVFYDGQRIPAMYVHDIKPLLSCGPSYGKL